MSLALLERQRLLLTQMWESSLAKERRQIENKALERLNLGIGTIYDYARTKTKTAEAELNLKLFQSRYQSISAFLSQLGIDENFSLPPIKIDLQMLPDVLNLHAPHGDLRAALVRQETPAAPKQGRG